MLGTVDARSMSDVQSGSGCGDASTSHVTKGVHLGVDNRGLGVAEAVFAAVVSDAFEHAVPAGTEWSSVTGEDCAYFETLRFGLQSG